MGFKGERIGAFVLDAKLGACPEGQLWRVRRDDGGAGVCVLYYEAAWVGAIREAGLPAGLPAHRNLSRVLGADLGTHRPWAVWSHESERTLAGVLADHRYVPLAAALPLILQLAEGLEVLHSARLAHHDIRPGTVAVDAEGGAQLAFAQTAPMRQLVLGRLELPEPLAAETKTYRPPEQRQGKIAGAAGDLYQLGYLVFVLLTGEEPDPFELRLPSQRDRRIPKVLDELVLGALERRVRARIPDAIGLGAMLAEGYEKAGYRLVRRGPPLGWVTGTPYADGEGPDRARLETLFAGGG